MLFESSLRSRKRFCRDRAPVRTGLPKDKSKIGSRPRCQRQSAIYGERQSWGHRCPLRCIKENTRAFSAAGLATAMVCCLTHRLALEFRSVMELVELRREFNRVLAL